MGGSLQSSEWRSWWRRLKSENSIQLTIWGPSTLNLIQSITWVQRFCWRNSIEIKVWLFYQQIRRSHIDIDGEFGFANIRDESKNLTFSKSKIWSAKKEKAWFSILKVQTFRINSKKPSSSETKTSLNTR